MHSPYNLIAPNQSNLSLSLNENIAFSQAAWHGVVDRTLTVPPANPQLGLYIFQSIAQGIATGQEQKIAFPYDGQWYFFSPQDGQSLKSLVDEIDIVYDATTNTWQPIGINNATLDQDSDGVIDVASRIKAIDQAAPNTFYGKNLAGTPGFYPLDGLSYLTRNSNFVAAIDSVNQILTASNPLTVTLPPNPPENSRIILYDGNGSDPDNPTGFGNNSLTIDPDSSTLQGSSSPVTIAIENANLELIYHAATGWRVKASNFQLFETAQLIWKTHASDFTVTNNSLNQVRSLNQPILATLPDNPPENTIASFYDGDGSDPDNPTGWGLHPLTIQATNHDIQGSNQPLVLDRENSTVELIFHSATGWRIKNRFLTSSSNVSTVGGFVYFSHTANFLALSNSINQVQTASNPITTTLPSNPQDNDTALFYDGNGSDPNNPSGFGLNALTINGNGNLIQGLPNDFVLNLENSAIELIYSAITGWRIKNFISGSNLTLPSTNYYEYSNDFTATIDSYNGVSCLNNPVIATLPPNPPNHGIVRFYDASGGNPNILSGFGKNPLNIDPNGQLIQGRSDILQLNTENATLGLIFITGIGWRILYSTSGGATIEVGQYSNVRELLRNDRILQVSPTGNDLHDGINSPLQTIQAAIDKATAWDTSIQGNTILQLADGNYGGCQLRTISGQGKVILLGTGNSIVTSSIQGKYRGTYVTRDIKIDTGINTGISIVNGNLEISDNTEFGLCGTQIELTAANLTIAGNYKISGNGSSHIKATHNSWIRAENHACTLENTPHFDRGFIISSLNSSIYFNSNNFSFIGLATGIRYRVDYGGVIVTEFGGQTYFPGSISGLTIDGGNYYG